MLWSALLPDLLPFAPGVSEPAAHRALRRAATDFFRRTRAWQVWLPEIVVQPGLQSYDLQLPAGSMVTQIRQATVGGHPVGVQAFANLAADPGLHPGRVSGVASPDRVKVVLGTDLGTGQALQVQACLTCSDWADQAPDALMTQHREAIVDGAVARLLIEPGKPFSDPNMAAISSGRFEMEIAKVAAQVYRDFTADMPRQRPQWC